MCTLNMLDYKSQKEILKETVSPTKALQIAIYINMGASINRKIIKT